MGTSPQTLAENRAVYSERRTDSSAFIGSKGAAVCLFVCSSKHKLRYGERTDQICAGCSSAAHLAWRRHLRQKTEWSWRGRRGPWGPLSFDCGLLTWCPSEQTNLERDDLSHGRAVCLLRINLRWIFICSLPQNTHTIAEFDRLPSFRKFTGKERMIVNFCFLFAKASQFFSAKESKGFPREHSWKSTINRKIITLNQNQKFQNFCALHPQRGWINKTTACFHFRSLKLTWRSCACHLI